MKELQSQGYGTKINSADDVSPAEEHTLWETGALNTENAKGISNIIFLYNCRAFGQRGFKGLADDELRNQILLVSRRDITFCSEGLTKSYRGGLKSRKYGTCTFSHFSNPTNPRYLVPINRYYLSKLPPISLFYIKPVT